MSDLEDITTLKLCFVEIRTPPWHNSDEPGQSLHDDGASSLNILQKSI